MRRNNDSSGEAGIQARRSHSLLTYIRRYLHTYVATSMGPCEIRRAEERYSTSQHIKVAPTHACTYARKRRRKEQQRNFSPSLVPPLATSAPASQEANTPRINNTASHWVTVTVHTANTYWVMFSSWILCRSEMNIKTPPISEAVFGAGTLSLTGTDLRRLTVLGSQQVHCQHELIRRVENYVL